MRVLVLVAAVAACGAPTVVRKKDGRFEVHGRVLHRVARCGQQPAPKPYPGAEIVISTGGKPLARPKADAKGAYVITLAPGSYCVHAPDADDCYARWDLPEDGMPKSAVEREIVITDYDNTGCD